MVADDVEAEREEGGEQVADVVVAGDGLDAEERLAVGAAGLLLHQALESEEGEGLEEEGGEGAGGGVALVGAVAGIGQIGGGLAEAVQDGFENGGRISCLEAPAEKLSPTYAV